VTAAPGRAVLSNAHMTSLAAVGQRPVEQVLRRAGLLRPPGSGRTVGFLRAARIPPDRLSSSEWQRWCSTHPGEEW
jgi:hypothetical protein